MPQRTPRAKADLDAAALHVTYELNELDLMSVRVLLGKYENEHLESSLLHARALIEFLIGRDRRHANDICPEDFVAGWRPSDGDETTRLREALPTIDQHLSHLSWTRVIAGHRPWRYPELRSDVLTLFESFAAHARRGACQQADIFDAAITAIHLRESAWEAAEGRDGPWR